MSPIIPPQKQTIKVATILNLVMSVLASIFAGLIQRYVFDVITIETSLTVILIMIVIGLFVDALLERKNLRIPIKIIVAILVTGTLVLFSITAFVNAILRPPTTYLLVDTTEKMSPLYINVRTSLKDSIIPNSRVGLRVYGGNVSNITGCGNTKQLIEPTFYTNPGERLTSALSLVEPSGHSSLVGAVLDTLNDLTSHDEPVKLIIVTSGTDSECDPRQGGILEDVAPNTNSNINIVIVSIGILDSHEAGILAGYVFAFHAGYANILTPAQLPQVVQTVSSYGSKDYLYSKNTPTPTP